MQTPRGLWFSLGHLLSPMVKLLGFPFQTTQWQITLKATVEADLSLAAPWSRDQQLEVAQYGPFAS